MITIRISGTNKAMGQLEREKDAFIARVAQDTLVVAKRNTPIDKGQARRSWRLRSDRKDKVIVNTAPHIQALERGHSKQAPDGILVPTVREISKRKYKI
jgi:hypothetical protein|tara:strand:- start:174 stop:470 length:297 start_codon:yes stop_codon:yes gene_type:complete